MNKKIKWVATTAIVGVFALTSCREEKKAINIWTGFGTAMATQLENILSDYSKSHADSGFTFKHTGQGGYDNLLSAITGSVSTRTYPQLAVAYPDHMAQYNESKILMNLDNYITTDKVDLNNFYPNYLKECQEIVEGSTMGLPFNKSTEVLTTNKTFVDALIALTKDKEGDAKITKVPSTWQEVKTFGNAAISILEEVGAFNKNICQKEETGEYKILATADLAKPENKGYKIVVNLSSVGKNDFRVLSYDSQPNFFITMVRQWGGTYTEIKDGVATMRYKSEETKAMLRYFAGLFKDGIIGIPSDFGEASYTSTPFKAYKTIFTIGSSAGVSNCVPAENAFELEFNPIPYNAEKPDCKYVISQGTNLVMFRNTDEASRNASWELLKTLAYDPDTNATFAKSTGYIPATKTAYNSEIYQTYLKDTTLTGTALATQEASKLNFDVYLGESNNWIQFVDPGFVGSSSIRQNVTGIMAEVRDNASDILDGKKDLDQLLQSYYDLNPGFIPR